jgi:hypothetical protein
MASLRYVVLRHEGIPDPHFDLMFETSPGSLLATWRSNEWPVQPRSRLTPLSDHRSGYLTYEGLVSGNRGTVSRMASGEHRVVENLPGELVVYLLAEQITLHLSRTL